MAGAGSGPASEVEETLRRLKEHKGVQGVVIVNQDGIPIRTTLKQEETVQYAGLITQLCAKARSAVRELDPGVRSAASMTSLHTHARAEMKLYSSGFTSWTGSFARISRTAPLFAAVGRRRAVAGGGCLISLTLTRACWSLGPLVSLPAVAIWCVSPDCDGRAPCQRGNAPCPPASPSLTLI